jgi:hypothetical protein
MNIDAPWLLRLYNGNFGVLNLQPIYSPLIGVMALVVVVSGIALSTMGWLLFCGGTQIQGRSDPGMEHGCGAPSSSPG